MLKQLYFWKKLDASGINLLKLLSSSVIAQIVPLLAYPVLTRLYPPATYGVFALYLSIAGLISIPATGRYEFAILLPKDNKDASNVFGLGLLISMAFSLLIFLISITLRDNIASLLNSPGISSWLLLIPLSVFITAVYSLFNYWCIRQKQFGKVAIYNASGSIAAAVLKILLGILRLKQGGLIVGSLLGQFMGLVFMALKKPFSFPRITFGKESLVVLARKYSNFPKYRMIHAFINNLSGNLPVFVFTSWFSSAVAGFYALAFSLVFRPVNLLANSLSQVLSPDMVILKQSGRELYPEVKKLLLRLFWIGIVPVIGAFILAPWLCEWILGIEWREVGIYLRYLLPWLFLVYLASPVSFLPDIYNQQRKALVIDILYLVLRIISLGIGILFNNLFLGLALFSLSGVGIVGYNLYWYLALSRNQPSLTEGNIPPLIENKDHWEE